MIIILKENGNNESYEGLVRFIEANDLNYTVSAGEHKSVMCVLGDTSHIDVDSIKSFYCVEDVKRVQEPYLLAGKELYSDSTVIHVKGRHIGGGGLSYIAGPCTIESEEQIFSLAEKIEAAGGQFLRGGAFKGRTSPYSFQGLGPEGIKLLVAAGQAHGLATVSEILDISQLDYFDDIDIIQVGARSMQNFELLKELGTTGKPILLKRALSGTLTELLMSAEYILNQGNPNVILCERGIRTFETSTRNTLDISAVPVLKAKTHLPVIVDPSHAVGISKYVCPMALAAVAAGADGIMLEVHDNPEAALCDGQQSITSTQFTEILEKSKKIYNAIN